MMQDNKPTHITVRRQEGVMSESEFISWRKMSFSGRTKIKLFRIVNSHLNFLKQLDSYREKSNGVCKTLLHVLLQIFKINMSGTRAISLVQVRSYCPQIYCASGINIYIFFNEILNEIEKYSSLQTKLRIKRAVVFDYTHTVKILLKKV